SLLLKRWKFPKYLQYNRKIGWGELRAFFSYLFILPFKSYRWNAARFLLETSIRRPKLFVSAVSLGVQGHHFRQITRSAFEAFHLADYFAQKRAAYSRMLAQCRENLAQYRDNFAQYRDNTARSKEALLAEYRQYYEDTLKEAQKRMRKAHKEVRETIYGEYERFAREIGEMYHQLVLTISNQSV
ncbi:MAG: DUF4070 domain-containing protein, partial [Candidatus Hinthialibacter sp.]